jgi:putative ABC transport system substrate-binding protein
LALPGGNATGFLTAEFSIGGKWLELLKQIAPGVTRVAVLRTTNTPPAFGQFAVIQAMASSLGVEVNPVNLRDAPPLPRLPTWRTWVKERLTGASSSLTRVPS